MELFSWQTCYSSPALGNIDNDDEGLCWTGTLDSDTGTFFVRAYVTSVASSEAALLTVQSDGDNEMALVVDDVNPPRAKAWFTGAGTQDSSTGANGSTGSWQWFGLSYDITNDSLSAYSGGSWTEDAGEGLGAFNDFTDIKICVGDDGIWASHTETLSMDYYYHIFGEYEAAAPSL